MKTASYAGNYPPLAYLLPGLAMRAASGPEQALLIGRLVAAGSCALLILLALMAIPRGAQPLLAGLCLAMTPMVVFLAGSLNPSGLETIGAMVLAVGLAAIVIGRATRITTVTCCVGVAVLGMTRTIGPVWVAAQLLTFGLLLASPAIRRRAGRSWIPIAAVTLISTTASVWWSAVSTADGPRTLLTLQYLPEAVAALPSQLRGQLGVFGWLDAPMPDWAYWLWGGVALTFVAAALAAAERAHKLALVLAVIVFAGSAVSVPALLLMPYGWGGQGRYSLPAAVVVPILAGAILAGRGQRLTRLASPAVGLIVGVLQFVAWCADARRYAVGGHGRWLFFVSPQWSPPLGWAPWICLAAISAALLATGVFLDGLRLRPDAEPDLR